MACDLKWQHFLLQIPGLTVRVKMHTPKRDEGVNGRFDCLGVVRWPEINSVVSDLGTGAAIERR